MLQYHIVSVKWYLHTSGKNNTLVPSVDTKEAKQWNERAIDANLGVRWNDGCQLAHDNKYGNWQNVGSQWRFRQLSASDSRRLNLSCSEWNGAYAIATHGKIYDVYHAFWIWTTTDNPRRSKHMQDRVQRRKTVSWNILDRCLTGKLSVLLNAYQFSFWGAFI